MRNLQQVACCSSTNASQLQQLQRPSPSPSALCLHSQLRAMSRMLCQSSCPRDNWHSIFESDCLSGRNGAGNGFDATAAATAARPSQDELHAFSAHIFHKSQFAVQSSLMAQFAANPMRLLDIHHRC